MPRAVLGMALPAGAVCAFLWTRLELHGPARDAALAAAGALAGLGLASLLWAASCESVDPAQRVYREWTRQFGRRWRVRVERPLHGVTRVVCTRAPGSFSRGRGWVWWVRLEGSGESLTLSPYFHPDNAEQVAERLARALQVPRVEEDAPVPPGWAPNRAPTLEGEPGTDWDPAAGGGRWGAAPALLVLGAALTAWVAAREPWLDQVIARHRSEAVKQLERLRAAGGAALTAPALVREGFLLGDAAGPSFGYPGSSSANAGVFHVEDLGLRESPPGVAPRVVREPFWLRDCVSFVDRSCFANGATTWSLWAMPTLAETELSHLARLRYVLVLRPPVDAAVGGPRPTYAAEALLVALEGGHVLGGVRFEVREPETGWALRLATERALRERVSACAPVSWFE